MTNEQVPVATGATTQQSYLHLTEENIVRVVKEIINTKRSSFTLDDLYPYFGIVPAKNEVARLIKPLGYEPDSDSLNVFVKANNLKIDDVILSKDKKDEIKAAIAQDTNRDLIFTQWGFSDVLEKGTAIALLFWGIPGTGKTLMAEAIAGETKSDLRIYGTAEIESSIPGEAERTIKKIFSDAKDNPNGRKVVILLDECDSLVYNRNSLGVILGAQVNTLLGELEQYDGIVILTTNRLGFLDPALERRITTKIEFPFPDKEQRVAIWKRLIPEKAPIGKDVNFEELAKTDIPGGNIKNAVLTAARTAAYAKAKEISMKYFVDAVEKEKESAKAFAEENTKYRPFYEMFSPMTRQPVQPNESMSEDKMLNIKKVIPDTEQKV